MSDHAMTLAKRFEKRAARLQPKFRAKAIERYVNLDIEINSEASVRIVYDYEPQTVNPNVKGAWVQAWVWVE